MTKKYCDGCNVTHTTLMCFKKPRSTKKKIKTDLTWDQTVSKWHLANPAIHGLWECYLQISSLCPRQLDKDQLTLEHVIPKVRGRKYKYDINNIKPACVYCNSIKGSQTLEALVKSYPQLNYLIVDSTIA
jgi:5-methylcytosine-specific restriction endonuclease McrA